MKRFDLQNYIFFNVLRYTIEIYKQKCIFSYTTLHFLKFELRNRNPFLRYAIKSELIFQTLDWNKTFLYVMFQNDANIRKIYIKIWLVCLGVCLFVSNKRQNVWTDRAKNFCGTSRDHREGLLMIKKCVLKVFNFVKKI